MSSTQPVLLRELELTNPIPHLIRPPSVTPHYSHARLLVRVHDVPIGEVTVTELPASGISSDELASLVWEQLQDEIRAHLLADGSAVPGHLTSAGLPSDAHAPCRWREVLSARSSEPPLLSVVVTAVADTPALAQVLRDLAGQSFAPHEVLLVDNRPGNSHLESVAREHGVRYVAAATRGLSAARNAGWQAAVGEVVAFTDDDVRLDRDWCGAIAAAFVLHPEAACVTGLILPSAIENTQQARLDLFAAFGKGFTNHLWHLSLPPANDRLFPFRVGAYGSGACAAFRREFLAGADGFAEDLGTGTPSRGGEDLDIFLSVILRGEFLYYTPTVLLRHEFRSGKSDVRRQLFSYGVGLTAMLARRALKNPQERLALGRRLLSGLRFLLDPASQKNSGRMDSLPLTLRLTELAGMLAGPFAYARTRMAQRRASGTRITPRRHAKELS